jgi:transposase
MATRFISLSATELTELRHALKTSKSHTLRSRCQLVLMSNSRFAIDDIAETEGTTRQTVMRWLDRYEDLGIDGLVTAKGQGRPPIVRVDNRKEMDAIEAIVRQYPQKLDRALDEIEEVTGKRMSRRTLRRVLKKTVGRGSASGVR